MRTNEFRAQLAASTKPSAGLARSPENEIFVAYSQLSAHGIVFTRVHLRRLIAAGIFPPAVQISPNRLGWRLSDLAAWKASRPMARMAVAEAT